MPQRQKSRLYTASGGNWNGSSERKYISISISDIEPQVLSFMEERGITPPREPLMLDGRIHRYPVETDRHGARSGAYCIHPDGTPAGWMQDFHLGEAVKWRYRYPDGQRRYTKFTETSLFSDKDRDRSKERAQATASALKLYGAARPIEEATDHPYLLEKHVTPRGGLRVGSMTSMTGKTLGGVLFIPCYDAVTSEFKALHRVFPWRDRETGKFPKGWVKGTSGGVFVIAGDIRRGPVFAAEGIATALSVYDLYMETGMPEAPNEYTPQCTVIACMDSGNLIRQAPAIRERWNSRRLIVVADDDEAGRKAGAACMEAGFDGSWKAGV